MAEGTIKSKTARHYGFISTSNGEELFFHGSSVEGGTFDALKVGQRISYIMSNGPKGPRAEKVTPLNSEGRDD